jgi:hypothetical protein
MKRIYEYGLKLTSDESGAVTGVRKLNTELDEMTDAQRRATIQSERLQKSQRDTAETLGTVKRAAVGLIGAYSLLEFATKFKEIAVETGTLEGQLVTMTGSLDRAGLAFARLEEFASDTPFTLDKSVQGFVNLTSLGLTPSERALMSYGNTAAAMGKDLEQMIEAVADASTFEFERLKEFGIRARQEADTVTFTFNGVETSVRKDAAAIESYLMALGEVNFGDAMANQMDRIPGRLSNLEDAFDSWFRTLLGAGGNDLFAAAIDGAIGYIEFSKNLLMTISDIAIVSYGTAKKQAIELVSFLLEMTIEGVNGMNQAWNGFARDVGIILHPVKMFFAEMFNDLLDIAANFFDGVGDLAEKFGFDSAATKATGLRNALSGSKVEVESLQDAIARMRKEAAEADRESSEASRNALAILTETSAEMQANIDAETQEIVLRRNAIDSTVVALEDLVKQSGDTETATKKLSDAQENLIDKLFPLEAALVDYENQLKLIDEIYETGSPRHAEAVRRLRLEYEDLFPELARQEELAKAMEVSWTRSIERMDDSLFDFFRSGLDGFESFKDEAIDTVKDLVAQVAYNFAKSQFLNLNVNVGSSGGVAGAVGSSLTGGIGSLLSGAAGSLIPGFASAGGLAGIASQIGSGFGINQVGSNLVQLSPGGLVSDLGSGTAGGFNVGNFNINPLDFLKTAGAGLAGGFIGTNLGEGLTGREAGSSIGATAGGVIGGIGGPLGAFVGSAIGGLVDGLFGGRTRDPRFTIGPTDAAARESFAQNDINKITQSALGGINFQSDKDLFAGASQSDAQSLFDVFDAFAALENQIAGQVDSNQLASIQTALSSQDSLFKKNSASFSEFFVDRFNTIFETIGGDVESAFKRLSEGLGEDELISSLDSITRAAFQLGDIQSAIDVDVVRDVTEELERRQRLETNVLAQYQRATQDLRGLITEFDNSAESVAALSDALNAQKLVAGQLALTYASLSEAVIASFGATRDSIETSLLSPEQLFNRRRSNIQGLTDELSSTTDPEVIAALVQQINQLTQTTFSSLDSGQQTALGGEFLHFLDQAQAIADSQIAKGLEELARQEEATKLQVEVDLLGAEQFSDSVAYFNEVARVFGVDLRDNMSAFSAYTDKFNIGVTAAGQMLSFNVADFGRDIAGFGGDMAGFGVHVDRFGNKQFTFGSDVDDFGNRTQIFIDRFGRTTSYFDSLITGFGHNASDVQAALDSFPDHIDELFVQSLLGFDGASEKFKRAVDEFKANNKTEVQLNVDVSGNSSSNGGSVGNVGNRNVGVFDTGLGLIKINLNDLGSEVISY